MQHPNFNRKYTLCISHYTRPFFEKTWSDYYHDYNSYYHHLVDGLGWVGWKSLKAPPQSPALCGAKNNKSHKRT